jgi:hypothetical protein
MCVRAPMTSPYVIVHVCSFILERQFRCATFQSDIVPACELARIGSEAGSGSGSGLCTVPVFARYLADGKRGVTSAHSKCAPVPEENACVTVFYRLSLCPKLLRSDARRDVTAGALFINQLERSTRVGRITAEMSRRKSELFGAGRRHRGRTGGA